MIITFITFKYTLKIQTSFLLEIWEIKRNATVIVKSLVLEKAITETANG